MYSLTIVQPHSERLWGWLLAGRGKAGPEQLEQQYTSSSPHTHTTCVSEEDLRDDLSLLGNCILVVMLSPSKTCTYPRIPLSYLHEDGDVIGNLHYVITIPVGDTACHLTVGLWGPFPEHSAPSRDFHPAHVHNIEGVLIAYRMCLYLILSLEHLSGYI